MEWSEKNARKAFNDDVGLPNKKVFIRDTSRDNINGDILRLSETLAGLVELVTKVLEVKML